MIQKEQRHTGLWCGHAWRPSEERCDDKLINRIRVSVLCPVLVLQMGRRHRRPWCEHYREELWCRKKRGGRTYISASVCSVMVKQKNIDTDDCSVFHSPTVWSPAVLVITSQYPSRKSFLELTGPIYWYSQDLTCSLSSNDWLAVPTPGTDCWAWRNCPHQTDKLRWWGGDVRQQSLSGQQVLGGCSIGKGDRSVV